jgi:hypothetical protein
MHELEGCGTHVAHSQWAISTVIAVKLFRPEKLKIIFAKMFTKRLLGGLH